MPPGFSWIDEPRFAAMAFPHHAGDISWLREHGIEVIISLTETPAPRHWINEAGVMGVHVPVSDMTAPSPEQFEKIMQAIDHAAASNMGVAVHCAAGRGRTGTVVAAWLVHSGLSADQAIAKTRMLRPGSIETYSQENAVREFAKSRIVFNGKSQRREE